MKVLFSGIIFLITIQAMAEIPYGFCAANSGTETQCTPVFPIPDQAALNRVCDNFARAVEADAYDSYLNCDLAALLIKHQEVCK